MGLVPAIDGSILAAVPPATWVSSAGVIVTGPGNVVWLESVSFVRTLVMAFSVGLTFWFYRSDVEQLLLAYSPFRMLLREAQRKSYTGVLPRQ